MKLKGHLQHPECAEGEGPVIADDDADDAAEGPGTEELVITQSSNSLLKT